jgi:hypothetical protein
MESVRFRGNRIGGYAESNADPAYMFFSFYVADGQFLEGDKKGQGTPGQIVEVLGYYTDAMCDNWFVMMAERFDQTLPYDSQSGALTLDGLPVRVEHSVYDYVADADDCDWETGIVQYDVFTGSISTDLTFLAAEKCRKKDSPGDCNRHNTIVGSVSVLPDANQTPFDGEWQMAGFVGVDWDEGRFTGTVYW